MARVYCYPSCLHIYVTCRIKQMAWCNLVPSTTQLWDGPIAGVTEMCIQVTSTFKPCEDCTLGKAKKGRVCNKASVCSKFFGEILFFEITSPSTPTFGGKKHGLLVIEDSTNYGWSYFLKGKSDLEVS